MIQQNMTPRQRKSQFVGLLVLLQWSGVCWFYALMRMQFSLLVMLVMLVISYDNSTIQKRGNGAGSTKPTNQQIGVAL